MLLFFSVLFSANVQAGDRVDVRAAVHPDHARLVLDWLSPVTVERRTTNGGLTLRFDRPLEADLGAAAVRLGSHVTALSASEDGKELLIGLQSGVVLGRFRQFDPDLVVMDFIRASARPQALDGAAAVRIGDHDGNRRLVLDFAAPVVHEVTRNGRDLILTFDRRARIDAASLAPEVEPFVDELRPFQEERPGLEFRLRPKIEAEVFALDEDKIVIDFRTRGLEAEVAGGSPGYVRTEAANRPGDRIAREGGLEAMDAVAETPASGSPAPGATGSENADQRHDRRSKADVPEEESLPRFTSRRTREGIELAIAWPGHVAAAVFRRAGVLWLVFEAPPHPEWRRRPPALEPEIERFLGPAWLDEPEAARATVLRFDLRHPLAVQVARDGRTWRILLRPDAEPPAAVPSKQLDDPVRLRLLGDGPARVLRLTDPLVGDELMIWPLRASATGQPERRTFVQLELLPTAQGVVLRKIADGVRIQGLRRAIEIGAVGGLHLTAPVQDPEGIAGAATPRLAAMDAVAGSPRPRAGRADELVAAADERTGSPEGGTRWTSAPNLGPQASVPVEPVVRPPVQHLGRSPAETAQAAARDARPAVASPLLMAPPAHVADLDLVPEPVVRGGPTSHRGPRAKERAEEVQTAGAAAQVHSGPPLRLAEWALSEGETVPTRRARLMREIEAAEDVARGAARLDLARFFLAQAMAAETLAVLDGIATDQSGAAPMALVRQSLTGAAELLMGRLLRAEEALDTPALDGDPEVALWRAAIAAARNDWHAAAAELGRSEDTLMSYPQPLQLRLGLPAAMIALEAGEPEHAFEILDRVNGLDLHESDRAQLNFIRGLAHARIGEMDRAAEIWRAVERDGDGETRLKAGYALATALFGAGQIGAAEALARLSQVRPLWRGHAWEIGMLDGLATIRVAARDFAGAVRTWQEGLRLHPAAGARAGMEAKARDAFRALLSAKLSDPLAPVTALALYRSAPNLLPADDEGLELRRRLAAQLADLDLVEPARDLLETVLERLPPGRDAARDGALLAAVQLRMPDPAAALSSLDASDAANLPDDLAGKRAVLRATALDALGRAPEAIALLEGRADPASLALMNEILWRRQDWQRLAASLERSLQSPSVEDRTDLAHDRQIAVVKLAIARAHLGQADELARMRRRFGPVMRGQPAEPAFLMATAQGQHARASAAILARAGREMKSIQAWLAQP